MLPSTCLLQDCAAKTAHYEGTPPAATGTAVPLLLPSCEAVPHSAECLSDLVSRQLNNQGHMDAHHAQTRHFQMMC